MIKFYWGQWLYLLGYLPFTMVQMTVGAHAQPFLRDGLGISSASVGQIWLIFNVVCIIVEIVTGLSRWKPRWLERWILLCAWALSYFFIWRPVHVLSVTPALRTISLALVLCTHAGLHAFWFLHYSSSFSLIFSAEQRAKAASYKQLFCTIGLFGGMVWFRRVIGQDWEHHESASWLAGSAAVLFVSTGGVCLNVLILGDMFGRLGKTEKMLHISNCDHKIDDTAIEQNTQSECRVAHTDEINVDNDPPLDEYVQSSKHSNQTKVPNMIHTTLSKDYHENKNCEGYTHKEVDPIDMCKIKAQKANVIRFSEFTRRLSIVLHSDIARAFLTTDLLASVSNMMLTAGFPLFCKYFAHAGGASISFEWHTPFNYILPTTLSPSDQLPALFAIFYFSATLAGFGWASLIRSKTISLSSAWTFSSISYAIALLSLLSASSFGSAAIRISAMGMSMAAFLILPEMFLGKAIDDLANTNVSKPRFIAQSVTMIKQFVRRIAGILQGPSVGYALQMAGYKEGAPTQGSSALYAITLITCILPSIFLMFSSLPLHAMMPPQKKNNHTATDGSEALARPDGLTHGPQLHVALQSGTQRSTFGISVWIWIKFFLVSLSASFSTTVIQTPSKPLSNNETIINSLDTSVILDQEKNPSNKVDDVSLISETIGPTVQTRFDGEQHIRQRRDRDESVMSFSSSSTVSF